MATKRMHSIKLIREDYTYSIDQVSDLLQVNVETVRRWIRNEGLQVIPKTRPYLIHSSCLRTFIRKKQTSRKHPCRPEEFFCCRCQVPRLPIMGSAHIKIRPSNYVLAKARCSVCNCKVNKSIKLCQWSKSHPLIPFLVTQVNSIVASDISTTNVAIIKEKKNASIQPSK